MGNPARARSVDDLPSEARLQSLDVIVILSPFFLVLASIAFLYSAAFVIASPEQVIRPFIVLTLLIYGLAWLIQRSTRDLRISSLFLAIFVLGVCAPYQFAAISLGSLMIALVIWAIYKRMIKKRLGLSEISYLVSIVSLALAVYYGIYFYQILPRPSDSYQGYINSHEEMVVTGLKLGENPPDIYLIILDGYGRSDILREYYQYDNREFELFLKSRGFVVPTESRSNYAKTAMSVPSILNMDYVSSLPLGIEESPNWWLIKPLISQNKVRSSLENLGYQSVSITTNWGITDIANSDVYFRPALVILNDFESFMIDSTPLKVFKPLLANFALLPTFDSHRELILYNFETLSKIPELLGPKFIFAHIIAPHPPFVFDADGHPLQPDYPFSFNDANDFPYSQELYKEQYINQLKFINKQLEKLVDTLLVNSANPPIILLQADHGPGMLADFSSSRGTCLNERFSVFSAYYLPGIEPESIPHDITHVNLFRIILNQYFSSDLPLLENFHYYFKDTIYIFRTDDVTNQVDTCTVP